MAEVNRDSRYRPRSNATAACGRDVSACFAGRFVARTAYFGANIDDFLVELRASLAANTAIKMAGGTSTGDARSLASDMRTHFDFILGQPRLHFASYIRGVTPSAVSIPVPVGQLEAEHRLSPDAYERLLELNRQRVSLSKPGRGADFTFSDAPSKEFDIDAEMARKHHEFPSSPEPPNEPPNDPTAPSEDW